MKSTAVSTNNMSREEWVAKRKSTIGGSEIAVLLGLSKWKTPYELWLEKTGRAQPEDLSTNKHVQFGIRMEAVIAEWFAELHPEYKVRKDNKIRYHKDYSFLSANVDRVLIEDDPLFGKRYGVLEIKTTTEKGFGFWQKEGIECESFSIEKTYYAQIQHYLAITGYDFGVLCALVDKELKITHVKRDEKWINESIKIANLWYYEHIVNDLTPSASPTDYPLIEPDQGTYAEADEDIFDAYRELYILKGEKKQVESEIEELEAKLKEAMFDVETLQYNGKVLATWKTQKSKRFDSAAFKRDNGALYDQYSKLTTSRVFRLKGDSNE